MEPCVESGAGALYPKVFCPLSGTRTLGYVPVRYANQAQQISEMSHLLCQVLVFPPQQLLSVFQLSALPNSTQCHAGKAFIFMKRTGQ